MDNAKAALGSRASTENSIGDIADWFNTVTKQEGGQDIAFRKTLSNLLDG